MIHIEMLGLPGSGKTTLAEYATAFLRERWPIFTEREARVTWIRKMMHHKNSMGWRCVELIADCFGERLWNKLWLSYRYPAMLRFISRYPLFAQHLIHCVNPLQELPVFLEQNTPFRETILEWTLNFFSMYAIAEENLRLNDILLLEEGVCQQASNVMACQPNDFQQEELDMYLRLMPIPDCLIVIHAEPEICEARMKQRSRYPQLMSRLNASERIASLSRRVTLHEKIASYFEQRAIPLVNVWNHEAISEAHHLLKQRLDELWPTIVSKKQNVPLVQSPSFQTQ